MINTAEFEKIFLLFALKNPAYLESTKRGFFSVSEIDLLAHISKFYYSKFKKTPSVDNLWMIITTKDLQDKCTKGFFDEVFKKNLADYDIEWVEQTAQSWVKWKHLDSTITDMVEYVNTTNVTPENVSGIVETVKNMVTSRNSITFDDDLGNSFYNVNSHKRIAEDLLSSNYNFIDEKLGGHSKGTLNVYVAPPNVGKSLFMGQDASKYIKSGKNVLYISLEMHSQKLIKRIGSDLFNIDINKYDDVEEDVLIKKINEFKEYNLVKPGELTVKNFPTSNATADDIDNFIGKVEEVENIKYDVVIIDYINIMKDKRNPNSESTYLKIKNICEDLRAVAQMRNLVLISATQTKQSAFDNSSIRLNDIAESAGLAATCDTIMAIIQTSEMNMEGIYWLKLLKVRDGSGKNLKCRIEVDYDYMRLRETTTVILDSDFE